MNEPVDLGPTGGVVWADAGEWARRQTAEGCIICISGAPLNIIGELSTCWATADPDAPLRHYVCVVARDHVIEPYEMSPSRQAAFWNEAMMIARAVASVAQPIKMNYEIHGNTLPHLHLHLFPRSLDDPFVGGPIDPRLHSMRRTPDELSALQVAIANIKAEGQRGRLTLPTSQQGLLLRELTVSDADDYYALVDQNRGHLGQHGDYSFEQIATRDQIGAQLADASDQNVRLGVWIDDELVGRVDLNPVDPPRYALGYWLSRAHTGRGLMTAACMAAIDHARALGATEIYAGVTTGNSASIAVLQRLGFEHIQSIARRTRWRLALIPNPPAPVIATE